MRVKEGKTSETEVENYRWQRKRQLVHDGEVKHMREEIQKVLGIKVKVFQESHQRHQMLHRPDENTYPVAKAE